MRGARFAWGGKNRANKLFFPPKAVTAFDGAPDDGARADGCLAVLSMKPRRRVARRQLTRRT